MIGPFGLIFGLSLGLAPVVAGAAGVIPGVLGSKGEGFGAGLEPTGGITGTGSGAGGVVIDIT